MRSKTKIINQKIFLSGKEIDCIIRLSRRNKNLRFRVVSGGKLVISRPFFLDEKYLEKFFIEKSDWILEKINYFESLPTIDEAENRKNFLKSKKQALEFVFNKIKVFNFFYNFNFNQVRIKNQKNCWGSCSAKKNLNFNWKIINLPEPLADLIIVHELCHLAKMNHSKSFWQLVAKTIPDYNLRCKELKRYNHYNFF